MKVSREIYNQLKFGCLIERFVSFRFFVRIYYVQLCMDLETLLSVPKLG